MESLENTLSILDGDIVEKCVNAINKASRVFIYALSGFSAVTFDAEFKFQRLRIDVRESHNAHAQILYASTLTSKDVANIISYTSETLDIINTEK